MMAFWVGVALNVLKGEIIAPSLTLRTSTKDEGGEHCRRSRYGDGLDLKAPKGSKSCPPKGGP